MTEANAHDASSWKERLRSLALSDPEWTKADLKRDLLPAALIVLVGLLLFGIGIGSYGFVEPGEGKLPLMAKGMREAMHPLKAAYLGEDSPTTPLPALWATVLTSLVFPDGERGGRFASVLAALCCLLLLYAGVSRLSDRATGVVASLVLASMPAFYGLARFAGPDIYLAPALMGAAGSILVGLDGRIGRRPLVALCAGFAFLTYLTGGPKGILILAISLLLLVAARLAGEGESRQEALRALRRVAAPVLLLFVASAGLWLLALYLVNGADFIRDMTGPSWFVDRFTGRQEMSERIEFCFRGFIYGMFPWSCLLPFALVALAAAGERNETSAGRSSSLYLLLFICAGFILISLQAERRYEDLAPVLPLCAAAIVLGWRWISNHWDLRTVRVCLGVSILLGLLPRRDLSRFGIEYLVETFGGWSELGDDFQGAAKFAALSGIWLAGLAVVLVFARIREAWLVPLVLALGLAAYVSWVTIPAVGQTNTARRAIADALDAAGGQPFYIWGDPSPGQVFYAGGKAELLGRRMDPIIRDLREGKTFYCLLTKDDFNLFATRLRKADKAASLRLVFKQGDAYWFITNEAP